MTAASCARQHNNENKSIPKAWCPVFQRFTGTRGGAKLEDGEVGSGESLAIVERDPVTIDPVGLAHAGWTLPTGFQEEESPEARAALDRTRKAHERAREFVQLLIDACGGVNGAFGRLKERLEGDTKSKGAWLVLLTVKHEWGTWSVLHEAVSRVAPNAGADSPALLVLKLLTEKCKAWNVEIDRLERESDTRGTPLHLAAFGGSRNAVKFLVDVGAGVWTTARGKYPLDCAHPHDKDAADSADVAQYLAEEMRRKQPTAAHQSVFGARSSPAPAQYPHRPVRSSSIPRADALMRGKDDKAFQEGAAARCEAARSRGRRMNAPPDEATTSVEPAGPQVASMPDDEMQMLDDSAFHEMTKDEMTKLMKDPDDAMLTAAEAVEELDRSPAKKSKSSSSSAGARPTPTSTALLD